MIVEVSPTLNTVEVYTNPVAAPILLPMEKKTSNFDALIQNSYVVDTSSSAVTATLPSLPKKGDTVDILCIGSNSVTISRNSHKINGGEVDITLSNGQSALLRYLDTDLGFIRLR